MVYGHCALGVVVLRDTALVFESSGREAMTVASHAGYRLLGLEPTVVYLVENVYIYARNSWQDDRLETTYR